MSAAETGSDVHYTIGVRPVSLVDDIHKIQWLIEAARAATHDPDGASGPGMRALLDVIDDKLAALAEAVHPGHGGRPIGGAA